MKTLGAYYQAFKNVKATEFVLKNFKIHFPNSPVYLISDGGADLSGLATKYECYYIYLDNLAGGIPRDDYYNVEKMTEAWRRHKLAVDACNTDYMMILEDDVWIRGSIPLEDEFHMRGGKNGPKYSLETKNLIVAKNGLMHHAGIYGSSGGSVYNSKTFLKIYDDVLLDIKDNQEKYLTHITSDGRNCYKQITAIDCSLTFHFNLRGYLYEECNWHADADRNSDWKNYPVIHSYKEHY